LRHTDFLKLSSDLCLDLLNQADLLVGVECDAGAVATRSGSSACSVDVCFRVLRRLNLHDQINTRNVKATGGNISGHKDLKFQIFEPLQGHFTLVLCNVTMHHLNLVLDFVRQKKLVRLVFGRGENYGLSSAIANQDVSKSRDAVVVGTVDDKVLHTFRRLVL
jgi:hypothetical protein